MALRHLALLVGLLGAVNADTSPSSQVDFKDINRLNNESLLWGPYRPNLYFGVRPRIPQSLVSGLMWGRADTYTDLQNHVRYTCEQNEGMEGYGWDEYDTRSGGIQTIHDIGNNIDITTSFIKVPGGEHGGSWGVRIKGVPRQAPNEDSDEPVSPIKTMVVFYLAQEEHGVPIHIKDESGHDWDNLGFDGDVTFEGASTGLGGYKVVVTKGTGDHPFSDHDYSAKRNLEKTVVQTLNAPSEHLWQVKPVLFQQIKQTVDEVIAAYDSNDAPPPWQVYQLANKPGSGNLQLVQRMFQGEFEFDVLFSSASAGKELTSADVTKEIRTAQQSFGKRFTSVFPLQAPYTAAKSAVADSSKTYLAFAKSMFSNLIGGIGYFYGHGIADRSYSSAYEEEDEGFWHEAAAARAEHKEQPDGPYELFTSIPSRPFFPRGFLWDEGFHLLPISDWDLDLTMDIVRSWFGLMDEDGWIAREQILGAEARSKVPPEFQIQYPHYANPPTLFFVVDKFVAQLRNVIDGKATASTSASALLSNPAAGLQYLRELYPLLRRQYDWFRRTQAGDIKSYDREAFSTREAYRWRGRTEAHVLTSGLDDYPRPQPPHPGELHVDLMSWMGMMTKSLINIASIVGGETEEELKSLRTIETAILRNLDDLHWSEAEGCYCDATIDDYEENQLVCHRGYVSLFPLLTGLLEPSDPKVGRLLKGLIGDESELFSPHGLRSLSKKSTLYGTAENYWRSPVWININYLAVVQLHRLATAAGPFQAEAATLYNQLRRNIVDTVYASWAETGFAWEQYNPETGKGQRTQHFTGWTSLVVKIMTMPEVNVGHGRDEL